MTQALRSALSQLGLSSKASAIYISLLGLGQATASEIGKRSRLKRTTVYNILPDLVAQGIIRTSLNRGRRIYFVDDTRHLRDSFQQKVALIDGLLPELTKLHRANEQKPKIFTYEGEQGVRDFFMDSIRFSERGDTVREIIGPDIFYTTLPEDVMSSYVPERVKKGVHIRIIAPRSVWSAELARRARSELRQIRFTDNVSEVFHAAALLYGNRTSYISLGKDFLGVSLESETITSMQQDVFDMLWRKLPSD